MKLIYCLIFLCAFFAWHPAHAQLGRGKLVAAELFFDTDPGQGNGTSITLQGNANDALRQALQTATLSLPAGSHVLHVRYKDSLSQWSPVFKSVMVVENPIGASRSIGALFGRAYWNGNTAGATNLIILNGNVTNAVNSFIETTALNGFSTPGLQKLSVEIMGADGQYGKTFSTTIQFDQTLTLTRIISAALADVYWDNNASQPTGLIILNGNGGQAVNEFITSSAVNTFSTAGLHKLNVRLYDPNPGGNTSPVFTTTVKIDQTLTPDRAIRVDAGKVWLDNSIPSSPNLLALDGNYNSAIEEALHSLTITTQGVHTISVQFRDSVTSQWGPIFKTSIVAEGPLSYRNINVATGQLFWDNDTNLLMLPLIAFDGAYSDAVESAFRDNVSTPGAGLHLLCARFKDVANNWSSTFRIPIKIDNPITFRDMKLVQGEVQISDTSFMVIALSGNFNDVLQSAQTSFLSGPIPTGLHKMKVRMKGLDAHWGPWFTSAILVTNCISAANPTITASGPMSFCNGGQVTLTASAGYNTYTWYRNNVQVGTGTTFTATQSGAYVVVVTDGTNCPGASPAATVNVNIPDATITGHPTFCAGTTDSLMVPQGYTSYSWSGGGSTYKKFINAAGTYTVTVTNSSGCTNSSSITINMLPQPTQPIVTPSGSTSFCAGQQVTLTSNVTGNIQWNVGPTSPSITVDTSGTYFVTVTGSNGCTNSSVPITTTLYAQPTAIIYASGSLTLCAGQQVTLSTDTASSYLWSNGATTPSIQVSTAGNYSVIRTVNSGCQAQSSTVTVVVNPVPTVPIITASGPISFCNGGSVTLTSSSSTNNIWSNGATTQSITVTASAVITDTVTNSYGCKSGSAPLTIDVHPVASIQASGATTFCAGDQVTLTAQPTGGVSYLWSTGATSQSIQVTSTQNVSVIVTENGPGCKDTAYQNIIVHALPSGTLTPNGSTTLCSGSSLTLQTSGSPNCIYQWYFNGSPITYSVYQLNCSCYQTYNVYGYSLSVSNQGSYQAKIIDTLTGCYSFTNTLAVTVILPPKPIITANGGTTLCIGQNTQLTSTPAVSYLWSTGATTQSINAATAGNYVVTITDGNGCTRSSDPTPVSFYPIASIIPSGPTTFCAGGSVNLSSSITGSYQWSTGSTAASIQNISTAGVYTLAVTDVNGCTSPTASINIVVNPLPIGAIQLSGSASACSGNSVNFTTTPVPHCIYKWYRNGVALSYPSYSYQCMCTVTAYIYGYTYGATSSGLYSAEIIDTLTGCTSMTNAINATILPLPYPVITQTAFNTCYGQASASLLGSASGTVSPYTYHWSTNANTASISNLPAGTYTLTATDANGCSRDTAYTVAQPAPVAAYASSPTNTRGYQISCYGGNDGSASVTPSGGTPPYTYLWNTGATTATLSNLYAGTYTVTVFDANGCTPGTAVVTLTQPPTLSVTATPVLHYGGNHISCYGGHDGRINTQIVGGTATMTYAWSNGYTSANADSLIAGTYSVTVTDSVGCTASASATLTQPNSLTHNFITSQYTGYEISCFGLHDGSIQTNVNGGTSPYHIFWTDSSYSMNRSNLGAGTYHAVITDTLGCVNLDSVILHQPDSIQLTTTNDTLNCYGDQNGTVVATAIGTHSPFTYQWTNLGNSSTQSNLTAGTYIVTSTDSRGCTQVAQAVVSQPAAVQAYAFGTFIGCGTQIGLLSVTGTGGTAPYTQLWSNGSTASFQNNQPLGTYSVTLTDSHGCIDTATAIILQPPTLTATVTNYSTTCDSITTVPAGHVSVSVSGGVAPYMYLWSNGATTSSIQNLTTGFYSVVVTDANGCTVNPVAHAFNNDAASFTGDTLVCIGEMAHLTAMPGSNYQWKVGSIVLSTSQTANLDPGIYTLSMVNLNGCAQSKTFHVIEHNCNTILNLKCYLEGYYEGVGMMRSVLMNQGVSSVATECDTLTVELHAALPPYAVIQSNQVVLHTNGTAMVSYPPFTNQVYVVVKQRNHIETWSAQPILLQPGNNTFDFSSSNMNAYGANQQQVAPGIWAFYGGDLNQDQSIDAFDFLILDPDVMLGVGGYYHTDLNGDGAVDAFDYLVMEPNIVEGVGASTP